VGRRISSASPLGSMRKTVAQQQEQEEEATKSP